MTHIALSPMPHTTLFFKHHARCVPLSTHLQRRNQQDWSCPWGGEPTMGDQWLLQGFTLIFFSRIYNQFQKVGSRIRNKIYICMLFSWIWQEAIVSCLQSDASKPDLDSLWAIIDFYKQHRKLSLFLRDLDRGSAKGKRWFVR